DNCGTFELLLPHIIKENNLHVIAIDEPGCGLSSHLPAGAEYPKWGLVKEMKRVANYLEWKNFSIIGHSRGAGFSIFFAAMFPEMVQSVIAIDAFGAFFTKENYPYTDREGLVLNKLLSFDEKLMKTPNLEETAPVYSEEEAVKRIMTATPFGLTPKTARILMKRGSKQHKGGYIFTRDLRHKLPIMGPLPTRADLLEFSERIRCDLLILLATKGPFSHFDSTDWFDIYKSKCRTFKSVTVKGKHYIHMDVPEEVASHINEFLQESILKGPIANVEFL
ncbi:serine hydrolase-like protein, partial [Leptotrombidium deliense]